MGESVSVIIPTYNRADALRRALDSVFAQTHKADEVCIVDDGSSDNTEAIMRTEYPDVRYVKQENKGVSAARNRGVELTEGDWIAFLDSDDEWLPNKLEVQLSALESSPRNRLVHSDEIWIRNGRRVNQMNKHKKRGGYIFPHCLPLCAISPSSVLIERSLFCDTGGFDESLPACEDYDLWLRICQSEEVIYVDEPLLRKFGGHEDQLSRLHWGMDRFRVRALAKLLRAQTLAPDQDAMVRKTLHEKVIILMNGAIKRNKADNVAQYKKILFEFGMSAEVAHD